MRFIINFKSGKPVYQQLVDQIKAATASGALQSGDALPSIRPLAEELSINRNTVIKAYTLLEEDGVVDTQAGKGCFIKNVLTAPSEEEIQNHLIPAVDDLIILAYHSRVPGKELEQILHQQISTFEKNLELKDK